MGYMQMAERAHTHGIKVYFATLTPYTGAGYMSPAGEEVRQALNKWIRTTNEIDGFIDFDKATRGPRPPRHLPARLRPRRPPAPQRPRLQSHGRRDRPESVHEVAASEETAMHYLMFYETVDDYVERRAPYREEHLGKAWAASDRGELLLGGALMQPD